MRVIINIAGDNIEQPFGWPVRYCFSVCLCLKTVSANGADLFCISCRRRFARHFIMLEKYLHRQQHEYDQRVQAILGYIPALVFIKDRDGEFLLVNREYDSRFRVSNSDNRLHRTGLSSNNIWIWMPVPKESNPRCDARHCSARVVICSGL